MFLVAYYVQDIALAASDAAMNKTDKFLACMDLPLYKSSIMLNGQMLFLDVSFII